jgi:hypothetical protein
MGEALSVGIGLARALPDLEVVVIDGDGNALMGLAAWSMMPVADLKYYILKNRIYETTGGQPIPDPPYIPEWCRVIEIESGKDTTPNPPSPDVIWRNIRDWLKTRGKIQG